MQAHMQAQEFVIGISQWVIAIAFCHASEKEGNCEEIKSASLGRLEHGKTGFRRLSHQSCTNTSIIALKCRSCFR